jgi:L-threonylcarbamoyladenylate synthase
MIDWSNNISLRIASKHIKRGDVIAYPTEAVWGLGCDPFNDTAVTSLLSLKQRSVDKGLILVGSSIEQFDFLLNDLSPNDLQYLQNSWPGPTTWLVPHKGKVPSWISGAHPSVALRVSDHPLVQSLCHLYGGPIVSTSANPQGKPSAKTRCQVQKYFSANAQLAFITQGVVGKHLQPSVIRDLQSMAIIRA